MLLFSLTVNAQIKFGFKAGATFAKLKPSSTSGMVTDYNILAGFQGGTFTEIPLGNYFSVQPELLFSTKGAISKTETSYPVPSNTGYTEYQISLKATFTPMYLDFPIHLKVNFASISSDKLTISFGPVFSYGLGGKAKISGSMNGTKIMGEAYLFKNEKPVIKDEYGNNLSVEAEATAILKRFDIGVSGFVSYEIKSHYLIGISYQIGLKDIGNNSDEELRNRCLSITMGYKF
jgi:hypothetical protein